MKNLTSIISISIALASVFIVSSMNTQLKALRAELSGLEETVTQQSVLGSTVTSTASSDTLETFRTNVNSSLSSLQNDKVSTTTAYSWTALQTFLGNATTTQLTATSSAYLATSAGSVGIGSTSPFTTLGIGNTGTSTISGNKFCMYFKDETGRGMWIKLATSGNAAFSTSTTACNQ